MASYGVLKCKYPVLQKGYHYVNSDFGKRTYTNSKGKKVSDFHKGIDVQGENKVDYVLCPFYGTVVACCNTVSGQNTNTGTLGMGNYVIVDCANGVRLRFQHLKTGSVTVDVGDTVEAGQVIGYIGLTGNTSGYHLHFDISFKGNVVSKYGGQYFSSQGRTYVDPKPYLAGTKAFPAVSSQKPTSGTYVVMRNVNVRKGAGTNYNKVYYSQFTANAKYQVKKLDKSCPNHFPAGVKLTIKQFKQASNGVWWGKCPSGWVCMNYLSKA